MPITLKFYTLISPIAFYMKNLEILTGIPGLHAHQPLYAMPARKIRRGNHVRKDVAF